MNNRDLVALRTGEVEFAAFVSKHRRYITRLASYFFRRRSFTKSARRINFPIDRCDLEQIGSLALWQAVRDYRWRCPECTVEEYEEKFFQIHCEVVHGRLLEPRPTILKYVHACTGRSMDHEMRRYLRRLKFQGKLPELHEPSQDAEQETFAALAELVEKAEAQLDESRQFVLRGLMLEKTASEIGASKKLRKEVVKWARSA